MSGALAEHLLDEERQRCAEINGDLEGQHCAQLKKIYYQVVAVGNKRLSVPRAPDGTCPKHKPRAVTRTSVVPKVTPQVAAQVGSQSSEARATSGQKGSDVSL
jgi:hypothetical protein